MPYRGSEKERETTRRYREGHRQEARDYAKARRARMGREAYNAYQRTCYHADLECSRAQSRKRAKATRQRKLEPLRIFHGGQCVTCGEADTRVLDFHHRDPAVKRGDVSQLPKQLAIEEAQKCVLLCANCHRRVEYSLHN